MGSGEVYLSHSSSEADSEEDPDEELDPEVRVGSHVFDPRGERKGGRGKGVRGSVSQTAEEDLL